MAWCIASTVLWRVVQAESIGTYARRDLHPRVMAGARGSLLESWRAVPTYLLHAPVHLPPRYMTLPPVLHSAWCGLALAEQAGGFAPPLMAPTTCGRQPFFLELFRSHLR